MSAVGHNIVHQIVHSNVNLPTLVNPWIPEQDIIPAAAAAAAAAAWLYEGCYIGHAVTKLGGYKGYLYPVAATFCCGPRP